MTLSDVCCEIPLKDSLGERDIVVLASFDKYWNKMHLLGYP